MSGQRFLVRWCFGSDGSVQRNGWYIDDVTGLGFAVLPPPNNDVGVSEIIYPSATHRVNTLMLPVARVKNYGVMTQTNFPVICSIFGTGNALRYTNTQTVASLASGDTTRVNFTGWTPTVTEQCNVRMRTNLPADQVPANDMMSISTEISLMYIAEGFNDAAFPPNGWQRTIIQGTYNWDRKTSNTYPTCAPYEGEAMASYQSFSASSGSSARLISPPIS
jgi:hypothetical protein